MDSIFEIQATTLVDLLHQKASIQPERLAYTFLRGGEEPGDRLTLGQLDCRARAIGALLQGYHAEGQRVLLLYPPGLEYIAAFFGCLYAGAIAIPSYPPRLNRPDVRLQAVAEDSQAAIALTTGAILQDIQHRLIHMPGLSALKWIDTESVDLLLGGAWKEPVVDGCSLAFLQYTSGSVAKPKGVMVSHANILANAAMMQTVWQTGESTPFVSWLPLFHDMGFLCSMLHAFYANAHFVLMAPQDFVQSPIRWLRAVSRYQAYYSGSPNFGYELCVEKTTAEQRAGLDLSCWKVAVNGAEPVRYKTLARFIEVFGKYGFAWETIRPSYGLAEATVLASSDHVGLPPAIFPVDAPALEQGRVRNSPGEAKRHLLVGCGRELPGETAEIVDPHTRKLCPPNVVGEIWVSGPNVAQGYWMRSDATNYTFQARLANAGLDDRIFLRTGDLGFIKDGQLVVTGRIKDLIILDGRNLYPSDIELAVEESHPAIRMECCAAFAIDDGEREKLIVVAEVDHRHRPGKVESSTGGQNRVSEASPLCNEIYRAIRKAVAQQYDVQIAEIVLLRQGTIPKTSSGKLQRSACRSLYLDRKLDLWEEKKKEQLAT